MSQAADLPCGESIVSYEVRIGDELIATLTPKQFHEMWFKKTTSVQAGDCSIALAVLKPSTPAATSE